jgi:hypothetical protein
MGLFSKLKATTFRRYEEALDPHNCGAWKMVIDTPWVRHWEREDVGGFIVKRTEWKHTEELLRHNQAVLKENESKRWGGGQVVCRIPMSDYFSSGWADAQKQGDKTWQNRTLDEHPEWRIFPGRM